MFTCDMCLAFSVYTDFSECETDATSVILSSGATLWAVVFLVPQPNSNTFLKLFSHYLHTIVTKFSQKPLRALYPEIRSGKLIAAHCYLINWPVQECWQWCDWNHGNGHYSFSWLLVFSHLPPFYLPFLFKWSGYQTSAITTCHKRKRCQGTV